VLVLEVLVDLEVELVDVENDTLVEVLEVDIVKD